VTLWLACRSLVAAWEANASLSTILIPVHRVTRTLYNHRPGHDKITKTWIMDLDHAIEPHNYLTLHIQQTSLFDTPDTPEMLFTDSSRFRLNAYSEPLGWLHRSSALLRLAAIRSSALNLLVTAQARSKANVNPGWC
jgi:hypothetical protein